ncbi:MAG: VWA domain-containing protein [Blastocatellia bacterium]|nr:VWA domain-containing protein [Blastocatellia bacterium]
MKVSAPTAFCGISHSRFTFIAVVSALLFISFAAAPGIKISFLSRAENSSVRVETFTLKPNGSLQVENALGSTRVETWNNNTARIVAEKEGGGALLPSEVVMMGAQNTIIIQCRQTGSPGRINLMIYAPEGARLQVTGGAGLVEVIGSLAGAVVETTSGNIGYQLPGSEDASVAMESTRGTVRSKLQLASSENAGPRRLRGRIGSGSSPIILNSQSGNITLSPAPYTSTVAKVRDDGASADAPAGASGGTPSNSGSQPSYRTSPSQQNDRPVYNGNDPYSQNRSAGRPQSGGQQSAGGRVVDFAGSDQGSEESTTYRGGPFTRPREERNTRSGSSGVGVKIIPSNETLNGPRNTNPSVTSGNRNPQGNTQSPYPQNAPDPNSSPSTGGGSVVFGGTDQSSDENTTYRGGPFTRPREERTTRSGSSGLRVRIIPSGKPLGTPGDANGSVYDRPRDQGNQRNDPNLWPEEPTAQKNPRASGPDSRQYPNEEPPRPNYNPGAASPRPVDPNGPFGDAASNDARRGAPPVLRRDHAANEEKSLPVDAPASTTPAGEPAEEGGGDGDAIVLNASLVNLNVSVTDRSGVALQKLKKEDFEVSENNQQQAIEYFAPSSAPFNLVLILDLSGSIQDKLKIVKSAALRFIDEIGPQDRVAVLAFTHDIHVISQLTSNRDLLRQRIKSIENPAGGTVFYEVMWWAVADTLKDTQGQRNAIVVMTDGVDSSLDRYNPAPTRVTFEQLARRLEESDVIVFPIYLDTEYEEVFERGNASSESYFIARTQLERISELTGGQIFRAEKVNDLSGVYKKVAEAIRTVYSVGYYSTNPERDGTFRRVRVRVDRSGAAVRTRKGYYAK